MNQVLEIEKSTMVTVKEAAERIGYSADYVGRLAREGKITAERIGRKWFVDLDSVKLFSLEAEAEKRIRSDAIREERKLELVKNDLISRVDNATPRIEDADHKIAIAGAAIVMMCMALIGGLSYVVVQEDLQAKDFAFGARVVASDATNNMQASIFSFGGIFDFFFGESEVGEIVEVEEVDEVIVVQKEVVPVTSKEPEGIVILKGDTDAEMIAAVRESFSDEVSVEVDGDDTGIITPIFREGAGDAYRFLMVPVHAENEKVTSGSDRFLMAPVSDGSDVDENESNSSQTTN